MNDLSRQTNAPVAAKIPEVREIWGDTTTDEYAWLRTKDSADVLAHLEAENSYTSSMLADTVALQEELFDELKRRIKETDLSVPVEKDGWSYYTRTVEGTSYPIHCRRKVGNDEEFVLLDENVEAADADYFEIGVFEVSLDHCRLLWAADRDGDERYQLRIREFNEDGTWSDLPDVLENVAYGSAWAADNVTFFYTRADEAHRQHQVWRHVAGTGQDEDVLVFEEHDEGFNCGVGRDKDDVYIHVAASSVTTDEVWILRSDSPTDALTCVEPRHQGIEYSICHHDGRMLVLTNFEAENFKLMTAPVATPGRAHWQPFIEGRDDVMLTGIDVFDDHLVLFERTNGNTQLRAMRWDGTLDTVIEQREPVYATWGGANPSVDTNILRFGYSSMVTPPSVFTVNMDTGERTLLKQTEVLGGFDAADYDTRREWATAEDGTQIPISLVWRRDRPAGPGPCVLYGYGAYEIATEPVFSTARLLLLDRGYTFAIAHVRGGGEMGRQWYLNGKFEKKRNSFTDFVTCAKHLIAEGFTEPNQLACRGGSAGGLLVGAVANLAPELFGCVVAQVPFVDALNTILDPSLPLTVGEWEEWGNPASSKEIYEAMRAYAPYENVSDVAYPAILATAGLNDPRVSYWEPAKWVQRLREHNKSDRAVLLLTDLESGHGGPSGRYDSWREEAKILAFILRETQNS